jgi:hypothetical protein
MRILSCLVLLGLLSACQTSTVGKGNLIVKEGVAGWMQKAVRGSDLDQQTLAVDPDGKSEGATYCPGGECFEHSGQQAVNGCSKGGKFNCAVAFQNKKVVWQGPVRYRSKRYGQLIPFHGRWTANLKHPDGQTQTLTVQARFGGINIAEIADRGTCTLTFDPSSLSGGTIKMRCNSGSEMQADYRLSGAGKLTATIDAMTISIDLQNGTAYASTAG